MREPFHSARAERRIVAGKYSAILGLGLASAALGCSSSDGGLGASATGGTGTAANGGTGALASGGSAGASVGTGGSTGTVASGGSVATGGMSGGSSVSGAAGSTASGGSTSSAGAGGSGGGTPGLSSCPAPPAGAPDNAVKAINAVNTLRLAMGVECANLVLTLDKSAQAHCDYYAGNDKVTMCEGGNISPHDEVTGCAGFTGADPGARVAAAGYSGRGWAEVMAFNDDPNKAVNQWVNSVWHRTPLLSPWWDDMGYGNATSCDVIDLGPGKQMPTTTTAMYPYPGQTGVTRSFNGAQEGPVPPAPPTGWPSGLPITLYVQKATTVSHSIEVMGSGMPLDHQWIDYKQSDNDSDQLIMYTDKPFTANTQYHVTIAVTIAGAPQTFDWTFTTGS
jgi:uncharacterized protein YkwD